MMKILFIVMALLSVEANAGSCTEIAKFDEDMSAIYVICPGLADLSDSQIADIVYKVLTSRKLVPDEYTIDFVTSDKHLSKEALTEDSHVGFYYTHDNEIVI